MANRPRTIREAQSAKTKSAKSAEMTLLNISNQLIKIHLRAPKKVDFYVGAQDVSLIPGQSYTFKKNRLWLEQVERLQKQRSISVVSDTEKIAQ